MRSLFLWFAVARNVARHVEQVTVSADAKDLGIGAGLTPGQSSGMSDAEFQRFMREVDAIEANAPPIPSSVRRAYEKQQRKEYERKMGIKKPGMWSRLSSAFKSDKKKTDPAEELAHHDPVKVGPRVRLTGLTSQPGLNGELADMVSQEQDGKIEVQLKCKGAPECEDLKVIRVSRDKLEDPAVALGGELKVEYPHRPKPRAATGGMVQGPHPSYYGIPGQLYYDLSNTHAKGRACRVAGTSQDALNGKSGTIVGLLPLQAGKPPRFEVKMLTGEIKSLKAGNIVLA